MADPVGPDVEAAPHEEQARKNHTDTNEAAIWERLLNAAQEKGFGAVKNIEVEKVVVLSFRNLQLRRIAGLQAEASCFSLLRPPPIWKLLVVQKV